MRIMTLLLLLVFSGQVWAADNRPDIAVLIKGLSNPYWKTLQDGVVETAEDQALDVYVQGTQSDSDAEGQLNLCNTMLLRRPKAIIFGAVNNVNLAPCLKRAQDLGIVLVDIDGGTPRDAAEKMGVNVRFSVASDNYELGKKAAQYLAGEEGKVLVIEGFPGSVPGLKRAEGFKENLPEGLELVASLPGDWDRLKAANIAVDTFTRHPDLKAVFAANDIMALGAAEALKARGIKTVKVIGVDGNGDAVKAIKNGRLTASIAQLPYLMGKEAVLKTHESLKEPQKTINYNQFVPIMVLDQNVLTENTDPFLEYVR